MLSRRWLSVLVLALVPEFSGCDNAPVQEVDPFQTRSRSGSSTPPPPTTTFVPGAHSSDPVAGGQASGKAASGPAATPAGGSGRSAGGRGRNSSPSSVEPPTTEYDVVGEEVIIDPDSHRGRAKKLKDRQKAPDGTPPAEPEKKP